MRWTPPSFRKIGVKRFSSKPLRNLHFIKTTRREQEEENDDRRYMSDISDEDENVQFISDLSSGEDELPIQKNKTRRMKRKTLLAAGRKKAVKTDYIGMSPSIKIRNNLGKAIRNFVPLQELPSQPSNFTSNTSIENRLMSDVSSDEDTDDNPKLKELKSHMNNYSEAFLTDDDEIESLDGISDDDDDW